MPFVIQAAGDLAAALGDTPRGEFWADVLALLD